jgi:hypothetical protein
MNIKEELEKFNLTPDNCIVVGSGILNALNIRKSKDIDVVVEGNVYQQFVTNNLFRKIDVHGREVFTNELLEVGTSWDVSGKVWRFNDLIDNSVVIDGVRYITLEFLLAAKRGFLLEEKVLQKDIDDVHSIENYLKK